jgi:hypothetical protein
MGHPRSWQTTSEKKTFPCPSSLKVLTNFAWCIGSLHTSFGALVLPLKWNMIADKLAIKTHHLSQLTLDTTNNMHFIRDHLLELSVSLVSKLNDVFVSKPTLSFDGPARLRTTSDLLMPYRIFLYWETSYHDTNFVSQTSNPPTQSSPTTLLSPPVPSYLDVVFIWRYYHAPLLITKKSNKPWAFFLFNITKMRKPPPPHRSGQKRRIQSSLHRLNTSKRQS